LKGNEEALMKIVGQIGPVAGVMSVVQEFTSYESGVFFDEKCINQKPNHAIVRTRIKLIIFLLLVFQVIAGYGSDEKFGDYWIIRYVIEVILWLLIGGCPQMTSCSKGGEGKPSVTNCQFVSTEPYKFHDKKEGIKKLENQHDVICGQPLI
jgi:hypothetical protein